MSESTPFKQDFEANDHGSQEEADELAKQNKPRSQARLIRTSLFVSVLGNISLAVCCVFLSLLLYSERCQPCEGRTAAKSSSSLSECYCCLWRKEVLILLALTALPGIEQETEMPIRFGWQYYAATVEEMEQVDRNWERINSDAGVVSIPHAKLAQAGVLPAQDDPSDPSKGVLSLQAYHSLHCLVSPEKSPCRKALAPTLTGELENNQTHYARTGAGRAAVYSLWARNALPWIAASRYRLQCRRLNASSRTGRFPISAQVP